MRKKPRYVSPTSRKVPRPKKPKRKYRLLQERLLQLPQTPEMREAAEWIGDFIKQNKARLVRRIMAGAKKRTRLSKEGSALLILKDHPDWTNAQIAKELGVNRGSVYRWKRVKAARKFLDEHAKKTANARRGFRKRNPDGTTDVEAIAPAERPEDE